MDAEFYQLISYIGFALAAVFLVVAIILFFAFDVIALWGEVSGKTAAKQVKEIREQNRRVGTHRREVERVRVSEKSSKQVAKNLYSDSRAQTDKFVIEKDNQDKLERRDGRVEERMEETIVLPNEEGTMVLEEQEETTVLVNDSSDKNMTIILDERTVLLEKDKTFVMLEDEMEVHTNEII